jgi:aminomethyltransferase
MVGLILEKKGVLRNHQKVIVPGIGEGEITSGGFSPTLQCAIALARVPVLTKNQCFVEMRGQLCQAQVVKPKFVHFGKKVIA